MNYNVLARSFTVLFAVLLAALLFVFGAHAFAAEDSSETVLTTEAQTVLASGSGLDGVNAQATSDKDSYAANTWAPLRVSINNESAYDIQVLEAGFESVPAGLEYRKALSTTYAEGDFIVSSGSSGYAMAHEMEVRKVVANPKGDPEKKTATPTTPSKTTAKTADNVHPLLLVLVLFAAVALAVYAARRMKQGGMLSLLIAGLLAAGGLGTLAAVPVPSASAAATTETAECEITIAIDGSNYTFNGYVTYTYTTPAPTPDPEPEPDPETVDVTGSKKWEGDGGKEHDNATEVKLTLYRQVDGGDFEEVSGATPTWEGATYTFAAQPKSDTSGAEYTYYVSEEDVEGYDREYTDADGTPGLDFVPNGGVIVNTLVDETIDISGTKFWRDGGRAHDNARDVVLTLYRSDSGNAADAEQVTGATPTWDGNTYTFADQPKYDRNRNEYTYYVTEEQVEGYDAPKYTNEAGANTSLPGAPNGGLITNELTQRMIDVTVDKVWVDAFDQDGKRPNDLTLTLYRTGRKGGSLVTEKVNVTPEVTKRGLIWTYTFKDVPAYDSQRYAFTYEVREETVPEGYTRTYCDGNGNPLPSSATGARNLGIIKNTHTPETITVSGTKTWTSSTGNNDDLDTSKIPEKYTVRLEKSTDGTNWTAVTTQEVASYMAPPPMSPTDPILPTDEWTFDNQPKYENGVELQYRVVEETVPDGFTMTGGTKDASGKYNLTNTYTPTTGGINLNVNFTQFYYNLSWIAKTVPVTTLELAQRTIRVGDQDIEVYMYTYSNPDAVTYYGDMPYNYSVTHWYDANGNELDPTDTEAAALIEALRDNAVLVKEEVTRNVFGGLFKDNVTKTITVTGPSGFSKSYSIKLGENSTFQIPITDAGEYTITQELVTSGDIDNDAFAERNTGYTGIYSIQTAVVNVTKDGDNFICAMDESKTMIYEQAVNSSSKPYTLVPYDGENPYAEINGWHQGGGTSAGGDTVTINHYMDGVSEL